MKTLSLPIPELCLPKRNHEPTQLIVAPVRTSRFKTVAFAVAIVLLSCVTSSGCHAYAANAPGQDSEGQKLTKDLIQKMMQTDDVEFHMLARTVNWEDVDEHVVIFVVDLWLTAEDMSAAVARINAYANATMSVVDVFNTMQNRSVENGTRRRSLKAFLTKVHSDQARDLNSVLTLELRAKHLLSLMGGNAAPVLASAHRTLELSDLGDAAAGPLKQAAENKKSSHRQASYFTLRRLYPDVEVAPLPIKTVTSVFRDSDDPFRKHAIKDLVERGHASIVIQSYLKKPNRERYGSSFLEERRNEIQKIHVGFEEWATDEWRKTHHYINLGDTHHKLHDYFIYKKDFPAAEKEWDAARRAFETGVTLIQVDPKNENENENERKRVQTDHGSVLRSLAYLYQSKGLFAEAIQQYRLAVSVEPKNAWGAKGLAVSLLAAGQYQAAADQFAVAEEIHSDSYDYKRSRFNSSYDEDHECESAHLLMQQIEALKKLGKTEQVPKLEARILWHLMRI